MAEKESKELVNDNLSLLGLKIKNPIVEKMIDLSCGFPNYLHLLCKYAAQEAILNNQKEIDKLFFYNAVKKSVENSDYSVRNAFQKVTTSGPGINESTNILLACALSETDHENSFAVTDVLANYSKISGKPGDESFINQVLNQLCKREKAEILNKLGRHKNARFRFKKPLLKAFVKMKMYKP
jgi:hypothetical protein